MSAIHRSYVYRTLSMANKFKASMCLKHESLVACEFRKCKVVLFGEE